MSRHRYRRDLRPLAFVLNDDAMVRALHVDHLRQSGFRALDAGTTDEAFAIITRRSDVEVVISDGLMRGSITSAELAQFVSSGWPRDQGDDDLTLSSNGRRRTRDRQNHAGSDAPNNSR
jgi:CheY-like chemotaxis protein